MKDEIIIIDGKWQNISAIQRAQIREAERQVQIAEDRLKRYWSKHLAPMRRGWREWQKRQAQRRALWMWAI